MIDKTLWLETNLHIKQHDDENTSTRYCICGDSFTWEGISDDLTPWMKIHTLCKDYKQIPKYKLPSIW